MNDLPYLINLPPFMQRGVDIDNFSLPKKITFIIKGKILSFVVKKTNGRLFCKLINFFFKDTNLRFENNRYVRNYRNLEIYFPNKRILRLVNNPDLSFKRIHESYCLDSIVFTEGDVVVDCGANVGELNLALFLNGTKIKYVAFEPDKKTFECLSLNCNTFDTDLYNAALSNKEGQSTFFLDNEGGNSSLVDFGTASSVSVETQTLDSFEFTKIKLIKIDAEGFEPEVLEGCVNSLKKTELISIDFGAERGENQDTTIVEVNKFLYENNFELIEFSKYRLIGLYRNKSI